MSAILLRRLYFFAVAFFLALPLVVVAGVSVNVKQDLTFPPVGFSLAWYAQIFADPEWRRALIASLLLAITSAAISPAGPEPRWRCIPACRRR